MGISVEYDAPDKCELVFGSNYHAKMSEDLYAECFQQAAKTSATVSSALHSWLNPMESQSLSPMREFMEGTLNAAVNKIINANNQSMVIDQFGIWGRKITDDGYSPKLISQLVDEDVPVCVAAGNDGREASYLFRLKR